jgi:AcrR family transcriptional regulator
MPENRIADIIRAAATVFSRKGYRLAQMEEIAKEANVSKATLYYYFKSKIHLFYYLLEDGIPEDGVSVPPPEDSPRLSERDMLKLLQERLKIRSQLKSIAKYLQDESETVDLNLELLEILGEMWDLQERHWIQIVVLEKSADEFPELAAVYDKYARREVLRQLERYIDSRMQLGVMRPLTSIPTIARMIIELLAWFSWKQIGAPNTPHFSKSETLPEMVSIFAAGLKK